MTAPSNELFFSSSILESNAQLMAMKAAADEVENGGQSNGSGDQSQRPASSASATATSMPALLPASVMMPVFEASGMDEGSEPSSGDESGDKAAEKAGDKRKRPGGKGRRKIPMQYITDKVRRTITFSKRKAGIFTKASELTTLTGAHILLLVVSESGVVYTFSTEKFQPMITQPAGKNMIAACLSGSIHTPADNTPVKEPKRGGHVILKDAFGPPQATDHAEMTASEDFDAFMKFANLTPSVPGTLSSLPDLPRPQSESQGVSSATAKARTDSKSRKTLRHDTVRTSPLDLPTLDPAALYTAKPMTRGDSAHSLTSASPGAIQSQSNATMPAATLNIRNNGRAALTFPADSNMTDSYAARNVATLPPVGTSTGGPSVATGAADDDISDGECLKRLAPLRRSLSIERQFNEKAAVWHGTPMSLDNDARSSSAPLSDFQNPAANIGQSSTAASNHRSTYSLGATFPFDFSSKNTSSNYDGTFTTASSSASHVQPPNTNGRVYNFVPFQTNIDNNNTLPPMMRPNDEQPSNPQTSYTPTPNAWNGFNQKQASFFQLPEGGSYRARDVP